MSGKSKKTTSSSRRQFTEEFKKDAVQMLLDGHSAHFVVDRLGLSGTNLLYRWKRDLLRDSGPVASSLDTRVKDSPMQLGLLTGAWTKERHAALPADDWRREKDQQFQEPLFSRNLRLVEVLRGIGGKHGKSPGQVAIAWVLPQPTLMGATVGARRTGQISLRPVG